MKPRKKARRPRERTARTANAAALAWYATRFGKSKIVGPGKAIPVPGKPGFVVGFGAIEGSPMRDDRPVEFRADGVLDAERVFRATDGAESTELLLRDGTRIGLRAPIGATMNAIRRASAKARR